MSENSVLSLDTSKALVVSTKAVDLSSEKMVSIGKQVIE